MYRMFQTIFREINMAALNVKKQSLEKGNFFAISTLFSEETT